MAGQRADHSTAVRQVAVRAFGDSNQIANGALVHMCCAPMGVDNRIGRRGLERLLPGQASGLALGTLVRESEGNRDAVLLPALFYEVGNAVPHQREGTECRRQ